MDTVLSVIVLFVWVFVWACMICMYFIPTFVATDRKHHNSTPILIVNLFFGWTFIGWVVALVWAFSSPAPSPQRT